MTRRALYTRFVLLPCLFVTTLSFQNCSMEGRFKTLTGETSLSSTLSDAAPFDPVPPVSTADNVKGPSCTDDSDPAVAPMQRLSKLEYNNVIRDLFGLTTDFSANFTGDSVGPTGFSTEAVGQSISPDIIHNFWGASQAVSAAVFKLNPNPFIPCTTRNEACAKMAIDAFALKAYRRPITTEESTSLVNLYKANLSVSFEDGMQTVLQAMLMSPQFIFRPYDIPAGNPKIAPLNAYELASRLSFFLWGSIPDETLRSAAANGSLLTASVLESQVRRMLKDSKADYLQNTFAKQWLGLDALASVSLNTTRYPTWNDALKTSMASESNLFVKSVFSEDLSIMNFISGDYTYLNQTLSNHYKIAGGTDNNFVKVTNPNAKGLLTQGAFLAMTSKAIVTSPVRRGKFVLARLLCADPGAPPANVGNLEDLPPAAGTFTESQIREQMAAHTKGGTTCNSCHKTMDPVGYAFENYDSAGIYRTKYTDGVNVNATGQLPSGELLNGVASLSTTMYKDYRYRLCFVVKLSTFAHGRSTASYPESCTQQDIANTSVGRDFKFSDAVVGVVKSKHFLNRTISY